MAATLLLDGVQLNANMIWQDRHVSQSVLQRANRTIGGNVVVWAKSLNKGQSITLVANEDTGWLTKQQMEAIELLANQAGGVFTLDVNGTQYQVMFRHHEPPAFEANPLVPRLNEGDVDSVNPDYYTATIRLMIV